ncbi:hypothetical protein SAZ_23515 [Streptomyces noursei ZPM]|nr:hypothetical protein SAZ_23515 [Streptomyces noursei ZPM]
MDRSKDGAAEGAITAGAATGSDFLQLRIGAAPAGGRADWLAGELRRAIADGRLPVGSRLPATRVLAADLRVSRGLVTEAYQRLREDGQVAGRGRAGTVVVAAPLPGAGGPSPTPAPDPPPVPFTAPPARDVFDALVQMTNKGGSTCSAAGFAGVDLKDADGTSAPVHRGGEVPRITDLKPGDTATFSISYKVDFSGDSLASPTDIIVTPPNETHSVDLKWPADALKLGGSYDESIQVHPVGIAN